MTLKTTLDYSVVETLRAYLATELTDVLVSGEWPAPDQDLPEKGVTVLIAGAPDIEWFQPYQVGDVEVVGSQQRVTWAIGSYEIPIQLDVWARYATHRSDILQRLRVAGTKGRLFTAGDRFANPVEVSVLLALTDGRGWADYLFDGPEYHDGPDAAARNEYRATISVQGVATETMQQVSPVTSKVTFKFNFREQGDPATDMGSPYDLAADPAQPAIPPRFTKDVP